MKIKPVHFQALSLAVIYYILSGIFFIRFVTLSNIYISFLGPVIIAVISSVIFLYFFDNKDFFPFWAEFGREERKKEKNYLEKFKYYGKFFACVVISEVAGPIFLALSVLLLFPKNSNRYLIAVISTIISTLFAVALAKGFIHLLI